MRVLICVLVAVFGIGSFSYGEDPLQPSVVTPTSMLADDDDDTNLQPQPGSSYSALLWRSLLPPGSEEKKLQDEFADEFELRATQANVQYQLVYIEQRFSLEKSLADLAPIGLAELAGMRKGHHIIQLIRSSMDGTSRRVISPIYEEEIRVPNIDREVVSSDELVLREEAHSWVDAHAGRFLPVFAPVEEAASDLDYRWAELAMFGLLLAMVGFVGYASKFMWRLIVLGFVGVRHFWAHS